MEYEKLLLNHARLRILQYAKLHGRVTAAQLAAALSDIPRATVYHHVKLLEEHGLLAAVEENRVRGVVERVLAPTGAPIPDGGACSALLTALSADLLRELEAYFAGPDADMERDRVFFQKGVFAVTDEEYDALLREIKAALSTVADLPKTPERRFRTLALLSSLPLNSLNEGETLA